MFDNFPKIRPNLPREIKEIYSAHYKSNREGQTAVTSLAKRMESWLHRQVANDVMNSQVSSTINNALHANCFSTGF